MKTLFLHPPSFDGFDGGAGSRYQAKREIRSFWYPTWLAQPAALIPDSKLIDAPADGTPIEDVLAVAKDYDLVIMHTSAPSFLKDGRVAELLKETNPRLLIGMVGAQVAVDPAGSLAASKAVDFVAREEFDYTCKDVADGLPLEGIAGLSFKRADGSLQHNPPRPMIEDMDALPWVAPVYLRDLKIQNYFIGYLKHPYVSVLHRPRLPFQMHVLPVAADGGRSPLSRAQPTKRHRRGAPDQGEHAAGEGDFLRRRHLHRFPSARRGNRSRAGQARRDLVMQREGERALSDAQGDEG